MRITLKTYFINSFAANFGNSKFALLFLLFFLHSCSMCSHTNQGDQQGRKNASEEAVSDSTASIWVPMEKVGFPSIADTIPSKLYKRICYSLSYNDSTRQPNWVMWQLLGEHVMKRKDGVWNDFMEDPNIKEENRATLADYYSSGFDRGHMCPGGDCNWNDEGRSETFFLSNMCPQNPNLNRGDWKEIEIACRNWAQEYGCVYIVCGPIFFRSQDHVRIGPNKIPVPEAFFKVVLCLNENPKGIGFVCRNTDGNRKKDFYVNSIRQVERITGYKFFTKLNDSIKNKTYDMYDLSYW